MNEFVKNSLKYGVLGSAGIMAVDAIQSNLSKDNTEGSQSLNSFDTENGFHTVVDKETVELLKELAITQRIYNSEEVGIDEHYENGSSLGTNASLSEGALTMGINGEKRVMTRRVYTFKGLNKEVESLINDAYASFGLTEEKNDSDGETPITE